MRTATIREASESLPALIAAARAGETVVITDEAGAAARLQPVTPFTPSVPEESIRETELDPSAAIKVGASPPPTLDRFPADSISSGVLDALLEERREGW